VTLVAALAATSLLLLPAPTVVRIPLLVALFLSIYIGAIWRLGEIGRPEWDLQKRWLSLGVFRSA
jgi:hypothetical protein